MTCSSEQKTNLSPKDPLSPCPSSGTRLGSEPTKVRTRSSTSLQLRRLLVRPRKWFCQAHPRKMGCTELLIRKSFKAGKFYGEAVHVSNRPPHCHRETSPLWPPTHDAHSVAPKDKLACAKVPRKSNSHSKVSSQASTS